jgi:hypothetical protein
MELILCILLFTLFLVIYTIYIIQIKYYDLQDQIKNHNKYLTRILDKMKNTESKILAECDTKISTKYLELSNNSKYSKDLVYEFALFKSTTNDKIKALNYIISELYESYL